MKYKPPALSTFSKCIDENQGLYFMRSKRLKAVLYSNLERADLFCRAHI